MAIIIAECCQNHKGDRELLRDMVFSAAEAGADYVKIQSMLADDLPRRERFEEGLVVDGKRKAIKRPYQTEYDRLKPMDLSDDDHLFFAELCREANIKPLTTPFARSRIPFLRSLGWDAVKVASYDCGSLPMLKELADGFAHLFVSTGATFDQEIERAAEILPPGAFTFLHCVTIYPTPLSELHLARMEYLRRFTDSVGFSDHSLVDRDGIKASLAALAAGADVIERHYTVLPRDETKDGPVSIDPSQLQELVVFGKLSKEEQMDYVRREIPEWDDMQGSRTRQLSDEEMLNRDYYRGRFASKVGNGWVYNWEDMPVI